eukprot:COSAG02_NODE_6481_length_3547_cov_1.857889_1_plen_33_part_10
MGGPVMGATQLPTEPCVLRTFGHEGQLNTCAQF